MKIRKANIKDLDNILELNNIFTKDHVAMDLYYGLYSKYDDDREYFASLIIDKKKRFVVVEGGNGSLIGFSNAHIISIPNTNAPKIGVIDRIFLKKEYRGKGFGKKLHKDIVSWLKKNNVKYLELSTDFRNKTAQSLAKEMGFEEYKIRFKRKI